MDKRVILFSSSSCPWCSRAKNYLLQKGIRVKEIKFYYAGQDTTRQFLSGMVSANLPIFALIINKKGRKIADSPENFAILVADLVNEINIWYKKIERINLVIDRHFHRKIDQNSFNRILRKQVDENLKYQIRHIDSQQNPLVNIADMAAGAILWKYSGKSLQFHEIIKENILVEKIISWPEIKRTTLRQNKKTHLNRCTHPSK
jgi:arsenate reductase-like glutaredoxin family protein